ncbi:hypothetical protein D3C85_1237430 [compost metagenome]
MKRTACGLLTCKTRDEPGSQIRRRQAPASGCEIALGHERLIEHRHAGLLNPWFGDQIRAGRYVVQQAQLCKYECARALGTQELARRIKLQASHQRGIRDDVPGHFPTTHQHRVRTACVLQRHLRLDHQAVHRQHLVRGAGDRHSPTRLLNSVEDAERDERIEFVETFEGKDGDVHCEPRTREILWPIVKSNNQYIQKIVMDTL